MSERDGYSGGIERRGVLAALAVGLGGVGVARGSLPRRTDETQSAQSESAQFVAEQGGRCVPITPLSGGETVEAFYDYRTPHTSPSGPAYSSYGTTDLQRPETSICFLYDGPRGPSLVVVHDKLHDGTVGGAVTFDLRFDHPGRGSWLIRDDDYEGDTNYDVFTQTADGWRVDWTWAEGRSDGGVYGPLGGDFAVTIYPGFNEAAALYGDHYTGAVTSWQILSGDRTSPRRIPLALDQPLTIRSGGCGERQASDRNGERGPQDDQQSAKEDDQQSAGSVAADVEIVPGAVNPRSHGRLPVVVHSTDRFDATDVVQGSVAFGPGNASPVHRTRTDADGVGPADLKLHFWMDETGIGWDDDRVKLEGRTVNGRRVVGTAEVPLVPNGNADDAGGDDGEGSHEDGDGRDGEDGDSTDTQKGDDEEDVEGEGEDDDHPGRGNGNGSGNGRGNGRGRGNRRGKGRGSGRGNGRGREDDEND